MSPFQTLVSVTTVILSQYSDSKERFCPITNVEGCHLVCWFVAPPSISLAITKSRWLTFISELQLSNISYHSLSDATKLKKERLRYDYAVTKSETKRICVGGAFERWRQLKENNNITSVARFLLDRKDPARFISTYCLE